MAFNKITRKITTQIFEKKVRHPTALDQGRGYKDEGLLLTSTETLKKLGQASKMNCLFPAKCFPFNCVPVDLSCGVPYKTYAVNKSLKYTALSGYLLRPKNWRLPNLSKTSVKFSDSKSAAPGSRGPPKDSPAISRLESKNENMSSSKLEALKEKYKKEVAELIKQTQNSKDAIDPPKKSS